MKVSLLIFLFAFLSFSFYQNKGQQESIHSIASNNSCLLKKIVVTSLNDSATIDTSTYLISYDKDRKLKRMERYSAEGSHFYITYEYDRKRRIKEMTEHYVLKIDHNGYLKGDVANRNQKKFRYKKGAKVPKQVKYLSGTAWERGIKDDQLSYKGKSSFEYNGKGELVKIMNTESGYPKSTTEFIYDYAKNTIWRKRISHTDSGDILESTTELRYDKLMDKEVSISLEEYFNLPNLDKYRFGNNVIYSKMVYGINHKVEKNRGKVAHEVEYEREYHENGYVNNLIKKVLDNIEKKEIGKVSTSNYEFTCE